MASKNITIKDIAKLAQCSHATVSRVLSGSDYPVSKELRDRVVRIARDNNYMPNQFGRLLKQQYSSDIGVIIPNYHNPYYTTIISIIEEQLENTDAGLLIVSTQRNRRKERLVMEQLLSKRVHAVVVIDGLSNKGVYQIAIDKGTKLILMNDGADMHESVYRVNIDNEYSGELAASHLLDLGHRCFALISSTGQDDDYSCRQFAAGVCAAMARRGIDFTPDCIFSLGAEERARSLNGIDIGRALAMRAIKSRPETTAIIASNDLLALGALAFLREAGYRVPQDISIIGRDDIVIAQISVPALTTIHEPYTESGIIIASILSNNMPESECDVSRVLRSRIVVRGTTGKLKQQFI